MCACRVRAGNKVSGHWTLCPRSLWRFKFLSSSPIQLPMVVLGMGLCGKFQQGKGLLNETFFSSSLQWLHLVVLRKFASSEEALESAPTWFLCVLWQSSLWWFQCRLLSIKFWWVSKGCGSSLFCSKGSDQQLQGGYPTPDGEGFICQAMHLGQTLFIPCIG